MRAAPLKKPDIELRKYPLQKVLAVTKSVSGQILFHPEQFRRMEARPRCYCGHKSKANMVFCESCAEWYHLVCVGLTREGANGDDDWKCGYCREKSGRGAIRRWSMMIPAGSKLKEGPVPDRSVDDTPKARGVEADDVDMHEVGPRTWAEIVALAKAGGKKINNLMQSQKRRAHEVLKDAGHHIVDEMAAGGLQMRHVDNTMVDDLLGQGLLNDGGGAGSESSGEEEPE